MKTKRRTAKKMKSGQPSHHVAIKILGLMCLPVLLMLAIPLLFQKFLPDRLYKFTSITWIEMIINLILCFGAFMIIRFLPNNYLGVRASICILLGGFFAWSLSTIYNAFHNAIPKSGLKEDWTMIVFILSWVMSVLFMMVWGLLLFYYPSATVYLLRCEPYSEECDIVMNSYIGILGFYFVMSMNLTLWVMIVADKRSKN